MRRLIALVVVTALMVALAAAPSLAQQQQSGLVNVGIQGTNIAVPVSVAVAANVCDVTLAFASTFIGSDDTVCEADAQSIVEARQEVARDRGQGQA